MSVCCFDGLESTSSISGNRKGSCDDQCGFCTKLEDMSEAPFPCFSANIQCSAVCCWQYLTISAFDGCYVEIHLCSLCSLGAAAGSGLVVESRLGRYRAIVADCSLQQQLF